MARLYPDEKYAAAVGIFRTYTRYSFRNKTPVNEFTNTDSDIYLRDGKFLTGLAGADLGFLINIGDVALADITFETPALKYLLTYKPSKIEKEVRKDQLQLSTSGITANGYTYHREAIAAPNHTYIVRCVSFSADPIIAHDYRIVFRTLRQLDDGSYIFAWKILKEFPRPIRWLSRIRSTHIDSIYLNYESYGERDQFGNELRYRAKIFTDNHAHKGWWAYDVFLVPGN